ncbi:MAG: histidinol-phosphate transaminase [bacterium]|nr:histidinol-phosphate transaminase [bacterium]
MPSRFLREDLASFSPYSVTYLPGIIKLDANENPFELPDEVKEEIKTEFMKLPLRIYPDPTALKLRVAIASFLNIENIDERHIAVGNGSDEILQYIFTAFLNRDNLVMYPNLSFEMFSVFSQVAGVRDVELELNESLELDLPSVVEALYTYRPKLLLLCRPNNPTGWSMPREDVLTILEQSKRVNTLVVIDEAYGEFMEESLAYLVKDYDNLIVLKTFSKAFSLAGLRLGYAISNEAIVKDLMSVKLPYNVNAFSQMVGRIILEYKDLILSKVRFIINERERVYSRLLSLDNVRVFPSNANFLFFYCEEKNLIDKLLSYGIKIRGFEPKHPLLENAYRVTIGKKEENDKFLSAMEEILS